MEVSFGTTLPRPEELPVLPGEAPAPHDWVDPNQEIVAAALAHLNAQGERYQPATTASSTGVPLPPEVAAFRPGDVVLKPKPIEPEKTPEQLDEEAMDSELFMTDLPKGEAA